MSAVNWTNMTDFGSLPSLANTASNGTFWVGMIYMMWIILIFMLIGYGFEVALMVSSFIFLIVSILAVYAGLMAWTWLLPFAGLTLFMFLYIIFSSSRNNA